MVLWIAQVEADRSEDPNQMLNRQHPGANLVDLSHSEVSLIEGLVDAARLYPDKNRVGSLLDREVGHQPIAVSYVVACLDLIQDVLAQARLDPCLGLVQLGQRSAHAEKWIHDLLGRQAAEREIDKASIIGSPRAQSLGHEIAHQGYQSGELHRVPADRPICVITLRGDIDNPR